ncbi:MAG: GlsB/YeaQ/YmgE family stress response membrane protein [Hyphomonadaceae bacterium]
MNEVSIIGAVVIGILAGWIAEQVMGREHGLLTNLIVGIVGAFLGAFIASALGIGFAGFWGSLLVSTVGAIVLLALVGMFRPRRML